MWIITDQGFVSLVEHDTKPDTIRARARRVEHLQDTFDLQDGDIIDLGPNAPDYRFHADVPRYLVQQRLHESVDALHYTSHVKEAVAGNDRVFYNAMLNCWTALYRLQPGYPGGWTPPPAQVNSEIATLSDEIAERMTSAAGFTPTDTLDVETALEISDSYTDEEDDDDEVLAAMLVLADEVRRLRAAAEGTDVEARRLTGDAIAAAVKGRK